MGKTLVIVESPAKCSKIQSFLGNNYIVKASFGHLRNINTKKGIGAIDIKNNFKPSYATIPAKSKYLKQLKECYKKCDKVIIASDMDREGEAIGYHIIKLLNLDINNTERIVFNEITKTAIQKSVLNPIKIDMNLVNAQIARQVLDFLVGFDISPVLWKNIRNKTSAGRCQSPALSIICDKEEDITKFKSNTYYNLNAQFIKQTVVLECKCKNIFKNEPEILALFNTMHNAIYTIESICKSETTSKPSSPYITSTIQQDLHSKLGISPKKTMQILQKLYEHGKITYMRTDSKIISQDCMQTIKDTITQLYGNDYYKCRTYKNKSKNAQEAHECIRPVHIDEQEISDDHTAIERKVYSHIWKRTVASQMGDKRGEKNTIKIKNSVNDLVFYTELDKTAFLGYSILYDSNKKDETTEVLDKIKEGNIVDKQNIKAEEIITKPKPRYNEASLIKGLEKKGIGRPSTYSSIVETLYNREYIIKQSTNGDDIDLHHINYDKTNTIDTTIVKGKTGAENNKIFPTELGIQINTFIKKNFNSIVDYTFTSNMENELDEIAKGNKVWHTLVSEIYNRFHPTVLELKNTTEKKVWNNEKPLLCINPENNRNIYFYNGKHGHVIQEGDDVPKYVSVPKKLIKNMDSTIAIELLRYPKIIGKYKDSDIEINLGRFGYYIMFNNKSYSIEKSTITLEEAIQKIEDKKNSIIKEFNKGISIRNGKYGPYIMKKTKSKTKIASIPYKFKSTPGDLSLKDCENILKNGK